MAGLPDAERKGYLAERRGPKLRFRTAGSDADLIDRVDTLDNVKLQRGNCKKLLRSVLGPVSARDAETVRLSSPCCHGSGKSALAERMSAQIEKNALCAGRLSIVLLHRAGRSLPTTHAYLLYDRCVVVHRCR